MIHYDRFGEGEIECEAPVLNTVRSDDLLEVNCTSCLTEVRRQIVSDLRSEATTLMDSIRGALPRLRQCGYGHLPHEALIRLLHEINGWMDSTAPGQIQPVEPR